jgi:chlorobactene glucosyltransferase
MEAYRLWIPHLYFPLTLGLAWYFFILAAANILEMRRRTFPPELTDGPLVSVLIPARNEEKNIQRCLRFLENQSYQNYEILVIDDNSKDGTWAIMEEMARENPRIRIYRGAPLPGDWYGKPYALQQLSREARGEILIFTDADTEHQFRSISWTVTNMRKSGADFISGYVGQTLLSFGERITVPLMFFLTGFIIPLFMSRYTRIGFFSSAVGQYIAIKKETFLHIGGFTHIRQKTSEDVYLARYVKNQGFRTIFLDLSDHVQCRMYSGYREAVAGIGKNIFDFLGKRSFLIFAVMVAVFLFLFLPFPLLFYLAVGNSDYTARLLIINILYTLTWMMLFWDRKITWYYALLWPLLSLNLLSMAAWSWFRTISGRGFLWKDRIVT